MCTLRPNHTTSGPRNTTTEVIIIAINALSLLPIKLWDISSRYINATQLDTLLHTLLLPPHQQHAAYSQHRTYLGIHFVCECGRWVLLPQIIQNDLLVKLFSGPVLPPYRRHFFSNSQQQPAAVEPDAPTACTERAWYNIEVVISYRVKEHHNFLTSAGGYTYL